MRLMKVLKSDFVLCRSARSYLLPLLPSGAGHVQLQHGSDDPSGHERLSE